MLCAVLRRACNGPSLNGTFPSYDLNFSPSHTIAVLVFLCLSLAGSGFIVGRCRSVAWEAHCRCGWKEEEGANITQSVWVMGRGEPDGEGG